MDIDDKPVEFSGSLSDLGDMTKIETKYPVIRPGLYTMKISGFKINSKPNKKTGAAQKMLLIELQTTEFATNKNAEEENTVSPGHKLTDRVLLTPVGDMTETMIQQKLARIMEAALGHHEGEFNTNDLVGKTVTVNVDVQKERLVDGTTYPEGNQIAKYIPLG